MNPIANVYYVAPDLQSFLAALEALKVSSVPCSASVSQSAPVTILTPAEARRGPLEAEYVRRSGKSKLVMTKPLMDTWQGDREAYAKSLLDLLPAPEEPDAGETYAPGAIPDPEDNADTTDY